MWTRQQQPRLEHVCSQPPHTAQTKSPRNCIFVPDGRLKPEEVSLLLLLLLLLKLERLFQAERQNCLPGGRDIFGCACSGVLAIILYLTMIQTKGYVNIKFHNQLHFKSYMRISGHNETLLREGPVMIPVDMDPNAFYLQ